MRIDIRFRNANLWRVVYDQESPDWNFLSRTRDPEFMLTHDIQQAPAVYGYSPVPVDKPNDYRVDETGYQNFYYELNNYDVGGTRDGLGPDRCNNFLFKDDTALYNGKGFPGRELLTMSGNLLEEIEWVTDRTLRYLKFKTLRPGNSVNGLRYETHPHLVHIFNIVQFR